MSQVNAADLVSRIHLVSKSRRALAQRGRELRSQRPSALGRKHRFILREDGGAEGVRTPDLLNAIQALYQLSYDPKPERGQMYGPGGNCQRQSELLHLEVPGPDFSLRT